MNACTSLSSVWRIRSRSVAVRFVGRLPNADRLEARVDCEFRARFFIARFCSWVFRPALPLLLAFRLSGLGSFELGGVVASGPFFIGFALQGRQELIVGISAAAAGA